MSRLTPSSAAAAAAATAAAHSNAAVVESLEPRRLLSAAMAVHHGVLTVRGTRGDDMIVVTMNPAPDGGASVSVEMNGKMATFGSSAIQGVKVVGGAGDDDLEVTMTDGTYDLPVTMLGGRGNDMLVGGERGDVLHGGAGND